MRAIGGFDMRILPQPCVIHVNRILPWMIVVLAGLLVSLSLVHCPRGIHTLLSQEPSRHSLARTDGISIAHTVPDAAPVVARGSRTACITADSATAGADCAANAPRTLVWDAPTLVGKAVFGADFPVDAERAPPRRAETAHSGRSILHLLCVIRR